MVQNRNPARAFGQPGIEPRWTCGNKDAVGTGCRAADSVGAPRRRLVGNGGVRPVFSCFVRRRGQFRRLDRSAGQFPDGSGI